MSGALPDNYTISCAETTGIYLVFIASWHSGGGTWRRPARINQEDDSRLQVRHIPIPGTDGSYFSLNFFSNALKLIGQEQYQYGSAEKVRQQAWNKH